MIFEIYSYMTTRDKVKKYSLYWLYRIDNNTLSRFIIPLFYIKKQIHDKHNQLNYKN